MNYTLDIQLISQKNLSNELQQKDENGNAYIGKTVANGFFGFHFDKIMFLYQNIRIIDIS